MNETNELSEMLDNMIEKLSSELQVYKKVKKENERKISKSNK